MTDPVSQMPFYGDIRKYQWKNHFIAHQYVDNKFFTAAKDYSSLVYDQTSNAPYSQAFGVGIAATLTKLAFAYFGALYQARRQFIPGFLFFRNGQYNFLSGAKFIAAGYAVGCLVSIFTFGHPFLVEDRVRGKFRSFTQPEMFEYGKNNL